MRGIVKGAVISVLVLGVALMAGCGKEGHGVSSKGIAILYPTEGSKVKGYVSFEKSGNGVRVVADMDGLSPGPHGFHIHEFGDCSSSNANSAGGHFNPGDMPHAGPTAEKRHAGDLGNIEADKGGRAKLESTDSHISMEGKDSIIGRSVVVHAKADDFKSQPTGDSGARVACGVIGYAQ